MADLETYEKIIALAKRRGFIYPGSELYGGLANTYDYGPVGTELLRNIRNLWWETFVQNRDDIVGLEASIISHQKVWEASGHVAGFADALIDCKNCKSRMRADHLVEEFLEKHAEILKGFADTYEPEIDGLSKEQVEKYILHKKVEGLKDTELNKIIHLHKIPCPKCDKFDWTDVRKFNQLFPVNLGIVQGDESLAYLRGETAQGMFTDFKNVVETTRVKLPFGIAQNGKSFRNEITPGNSVFRTLVFEQAEIEYFFDPENTKWHELFDNWKESIWSFVTEKLGISEKNLRWREHTVEERSFYSLKTEDLEYKFPFGYKELWGLAYRTDYDLEQHSKHSGKEIFILDPHSQKKIVPHVIEPAVGIDRLLFMVLAESFKEEEARTVLSLHPKLAPFKVAIFPLLANKEELVTNAKKIYETLKKEFPVVFDDRGNIGKRYLYQDEIGTPWCVTYDFESLEDNAVTVRDRDSMEQERIQISDLANYFNNKLG